LSMEGLYPQHSQEYFSSWGSYQFPLWSRLRGMAGF
jgi:hypothetical protein